MAEVQWIKIVTDIFDDEKILLIEGMPEHDAIIVIWFKLLCLAGKQNNSGVFLLNNRIPYTEEMFSTIFRRPLTTVSLALKTFEELGMVEVINNAVTIPNWEKHQNLDKLERAREATRIRVARSREKQKQLLHGECNGGCNVTGGVTVTPSNADRIDKSRVDKKRVEVSSSGSSDEPNPFGDEGTDYRPDFNTLEAYASSNLAYLSPTNMDELISFRDSLPDDLIRYAIDEACAHGRREYSYVRGILNRMVECGFKTIGEVKAAAEAHRQKGGSSSENNRRNPSEPRSQESQPKRVFDGETVL